MSCVPTYGTLSMGTPAGPGPQTHQRHRRRRCCDRAHHGGTAWLQLPEDTLARLSAWRAARAFPSWEQTFDALLDEAGGPTS